MPPAPTKPITALTLIESSSIKIHRAKYIGFISLTPECLNDVNYAAPVALKASKGPGSNASIDSVNILYTTKTTNIIIATRPANGPKPSAVVASITQKSSGIVLITFTEVLVVFNTTLFGAVNLEPNKHKGDARIQPMIAPRTPT